MARYPFLIILGVTHMHHRPNFDSGVRISLNHSTQVGLVWREFGGLNLDHWVLGNGQVSISDQFKDDFVSFQKRALTISGFPIVRTFLGPLPCSQLRDQYCDQPQVYGDVL